MSAVDLRLLVTALALVGIVAAVAGALTTRRRAMWAFFAAAAVVAAVEIAVVAWYW